MNRWLLVGPVEHWRTALTNRLWGFRDAVTLRTLVSKIADGDWVFFYAKAPVSGVVGLGRVQGGVFTADKPLWPDEVASSGVIYLHRFHVLTTSVLPENSWNDRAIRLPDLHLSLKIYSAVNPIPESAAAALQKESEKWEKPTSPSTADHDLIKEMIYEIGLLQGWIAEKEYHLEAFRLDVVWKRVKQGNPTVAFEVQIGGNLIEALTKLKHAFDMWNSSPILVTNEYQIEKAGGLVEGSFHEIKDALSIMDWRKVYDLVESKKKVNALELELGIPLRTVFTRPKPKSSVDTESQLSTQVTRIEDLVANGESETVEFKSSLSWDYHQNRPNKDLELSVAKEVCGFMNGKGGVLVIGIDDAGQALGLDGDFSLLTKKRQQPRDGFGLKLMGVLSTLVGPENASNAALSWREYDGKLIALVKVQKSKHPVHVQIQGKKEFCIRLGNLTKTLDTEEALIYIRDHWPSNS